MNLSNKMKATLILVISILLLALDNQFKRIAQLEKHFSNLSDVPQQLSVVQQKVKRIDDINKRLLRLEAQSELTYEASRQIRFLQNEVDNITKVISKEGEFSIFQTTQIQEHVDDAPIGNLVHENTNWGWKKYVAVGSDDGKTVFRSFIKFFELKPGLLKKSKILAATLYLKQFDNGFEDDNAFHETVDIYLVNQAWNEGIGLRGLSEPKQVTWVDVSAGERPWGEPGCSKKGEDYDPAFIATSGPNVNGNTNGWIPFSFNKRGIEYLQKLVDGVEGMKNHGFLIKSYNEEKDRTYITFYSIEYDTPSGRPYLEIIYVKPSQ